LTVRDNILFGLKIRRVPRDARHAQLARTAELLGLTPLLDRKPAELSGGQQQRVALARAIIAERPVCLMDEPLSNLDAQLRAEMRAVEYLGAETMIEASVGGAPILARLTGRAPCEAGDTVHLTWAASAAHWFDASTERRIG